MKAILTRPEHDRLLEENPGDADTLMACSSFWGPAVEVDLSKLATCEGRLGCEDLIDHLGAKVFRMREEQFLSYYFQMREILNLPRTKAGSILEVGKGQGILKSLLACYGQDVVNVDIIADTTPDVLGNILALPFSDGAFDCVCAFEVLEHLPFKFFPQAVKEMKRCAKHYIFLSLPCHMNSFYFRMRLRLLQQIWRWASFDMQFLCPLPVRSKDLDEKSLLKRPDSHNPHYWELNRRNFPQRRILEVLEGEGLKVRRKFHNPEYPYHFFVLAEKFPG